MLKEIPSRLFHRFWMNSAGERGSFLRELRRSQYISVDENAHQQTVRLKALLIHAYENVPFHQKRFDEAGLNPYYFSRLDFLQKLPPLKKVDLQQFHDSLLSKTARHSNLIKDATGGSTGTPVRFLYDRQYFDRARACLQFGFEWCGWKPGHKQIFLWGSDRDAKNLQGLRGQLKTLLQNARWINAFNLTEDTLAETTALLHQWKPDHIWGYATSLALLSRFVKTRGDPVHLQSVQSTAEVLATEQRTLIQDTFSCGVFDRYGSREVSLIAHECEAHQGLHVINPHNYVERSETDREGAGRILVTNLNNFSMPFIRYEMDDLADFISGPCPCGRTWPRLRKIHGRVSDIIRSPSGKSIHGEFFTHLFYNLRGVGQFQVIQETLQNLHIKVVLGVGAEWETIQAHLRQSITRMDPKFHLTFELNKNINPSSSGKFRFVRSLLESTK